jgi:hypothetical protein
MIVVLLVLLLNLPQERHNVLHQCITLPTAEYECVLRIKETFYFCGGDFRIVNVCITNLEEKYKHLRLNYVPLTYIWSPDIKHNGYSEQPQIIETPRYFKQNYEK